MDKKLLKEYIDEFNSLTKEIKLNLQEVEKLRPFDKNWDKVLQNRKSALLICRKIKINLIKRIELYQAVDGNKESGFSGLPGGFRNYYGSFSDVGKGGYWWSSTEYGANDAWLRYLHYNDGSVNGDSYSKNFGFSVRCLRD